MASQTSILNDWSELWVCTYGSDDKTFSNISESEEATEDDGEYMGAGTQQQRSEFWLFLFLHRNNWPFLTLIPITRIWGVGV